MKTFPTWSAPRASRKPRGMLRNCRLWLEPLEERAVPTAGNILVSADNKIFEYTQSGSLVSTLNVPPVIDPVSGYFQGIQDVFVDSDGLIQIFNGGSESELTTYNAATGTFTNHTFPGWSIAGDIAYGGVAAFQNYVFVTDMNTGNGEPQGIVVFDKSNGYAGQR